MKQKILLALLALAVAGSLAAEEKSKQRELEKVTVSGTLSLSEGRIALKDKDITYYVPGLARHVGFIDGLKDGAKVTLVGGAFTSPRNEKEKLLRVEKLTLNGKDYEISPVLSDGSKPRPEGGPRGRGGPQNRSGRGFM